MKNIAFISCFYNPVNFKLPVRNCYSFLKYTVNKAFSKDDFFFAQINYGNELDVDDYVNRDNRISIKTESILWHKERLLNILVEKFKLVERYKYICWLDTDVFFEKPIIVPKDFDYVAFQPYEYSFRPTEDRNIDFSKPFFMGINKLSCYCKDRTGDKGLAWVVESEYLDEIGGFFDYGIVGGGDTFFIKRIFGENFYTRCRGLDNEINQYAEGSKIKKSELNYLDNMVYHRYHGKEGNRQYTERIKILIDNNYSPQDDLIVEKADYIALKIKILNFKLRNFLLKRKEDE